MNTFVFIRRAAHYGIEFQPDNGLSHAFFDFLNGEFFAVKVFFHQRVVTTGNKFFQFVVASLRLLQQIGWNLAVVNLHSFGIVVVVRLHLDDVDYTAKVLFFTDRYLNRQRVCFQTFFNHIDYVKEVCAVDVHLVDESNSRNFILCGLVPYRFRLRLYAAFCAKHGDRAVKHAQTTLYLCGKVYVSRGVDKVNPIIYPRITVYPVYRRCGTGNGDTTLLLLLHAVHDGSAFMNLAYLARLSRKEKYPFACGSLARVYVCHYTYVTHIL